MEKMKMGILGSGGIAHTEEQMADMKLRDTIRKEWGLRYPME